MSDRSTVMGVLDDMNAYASVSAQMGDELDHAGRVVSHALQAFNSASEPTYQVGNCGPGLSVLGEQVTQIDSFVKSIADALRQADAGTISFKIGADATRPALSDAAALERAAGDVALFYLLKDFSAFDAIDDGESDGIVSVKDIERVAAKATDPEVRASAAWLLDHKEVLHAIDEADAQPYAGPDGKITAHDVARYMTQRAAYQVFTANIGVFDDPNVKERDGKVSRADIERMLNTSTDPNVKAAAAYLLEDERVLNGRVALGDQVAGRYDLSKVAKRYAEPRSPLPQRKNWARDIACGTAKQFSYLGYVDMVAKVLEADPSVAMDVERELIQTQTLTYLMATTKRESVKRSAAVLASPQFAVAATVIDGVCRITEPRKNWGTVRVPRDTEEREVRTGPPSTLEILSKQNSTSSPK